MRATWFFVVNLACSVTVLPASPVASDTQQEKDSTTAGTWWSAPSGPVAPNSWIPFGGTAGEPKPSVPDDGTAWTSLQDKLKQWPGYTWNNMPESKTLNYVRDGAATAEEAAKEKARQEICELIKSCIKSSLWSPFG